MENGVSRSSLHQQQARWARSRGVLTSRILAALLLIGDLVLLVGFLEGEQYRVRTVIVEGNRLTFADSIVRESGILGAPLFRLDTQVVAQRLVTHPAIAAATVRTVYPDTVVIELVERVPASVWLSDRGTWLVDAAGRVIGQGEIAGLPQVRLGKDAALIVGSRLPGNVGAAVPLVASRYGDRLLQIQYHAADGLTLIFAGGGRVIIGYGERLPEELSVVDTLLARQESWLHLDVRDPDRPVLWRVTP